MTLFTDKRRTVLHANNNNHNKYCYYYYYYYYCDIGLLDAVCLKWPHDDDECYLLNLLTVLVCLYFLHIDECILN